MEDSPSVSPEVQAEQEALIRKIRNAENHYEVLDLERDCTCEAVVKKFRRMALRLHPDKCALEGGHEAYAAMDLANQTLADPEKRKKYDYLLTLHRGRFLPDIDNHSEGGFDEGEGEAPEGGYIRTFGIGFIVCMATVGLYLYARLKVELAGFVTGRDGLPLHAWCVAVLLSLTAGLDWLEVLKWSFVTYFATKGAEMVPWIQLIQFQLDNANNMYGVPCWIGLNMVALSYHYLGFDAMSAVLFGILETVVVGIAILRRWADACRTPCIPPPCIPPPCTLPPCVATMKATSQSYASGLASTASASSGSPTWRVSVGPSQQGWRW